MNIAALSGVAAIWPYIVLTRLGGYLLHMGKLLINPLCWHKLMS